MLNYSIDTKMKLIKYCDEKFHPKNCDTIQFGTLDYYKESDNEFIADPSEGNGSSYTFVNEKEDISFSKEEFEWITNGGVKGSGIKIDKGGTLNLNENIKVPNSYIFCCSLMKDASLPKIEKQMNDLGYNSWYEITNPQKFIETAVEQSKSQLKLKLKKNCEIEWKTIGKEISYGQKDNLIFNSHIDFLDFLLYRKPLISQINKEIEYWKNTEFRFTLLFFEKESIIPVSVEKKPIIFSNKKLLEYIK